jgi:hypothetical protein
MDFDHVENMIGYAEKRTEVPSEKVLKPKSQHQFLTKRSEIRKSKVASLTE